MSSPTAGGDNLAEMNGRVTRRCFVLTAGAVAPLLATDSDFPGRNIDFIIPKAPGGGFDNLVRVIAPALEKYLPRKVNVVPDNIPAGGGGKGIGQLYRARPDGYTIGAVDIPGSFILQERQGGAGFDLNKITWLCALGKPEYFCLAVGANSPLKTLADLTTLSRTRAIKFTSSGPEGTAFAATVVGANLLGIRAQLITGYKGSSDFVVGAIRGDGDAVIAPVTSIRPMQQSRTIRILATFEPRSGFPGVPDATMLGKPELSQILLDRLVGAPPGLPAGIKGILSAAFAKSMADPQTVSLAKKFDVELSPSSTELATARVRESAAFYGKWKKYLS
jgi:tripartite-type tricarboxylate transporter receptor subunit TctC